MGHPVHNVGFGRRTDRPQSDRHAPRVRRQDVLLHLHLHLGSLDPAALSLRPADGAGVESVAAARTAVRHRARRRDLVRARANRVGLRTGNGARAVRSQCRAARAARLVARSRPPGFRLHAPGDDLMPIGVKILKRPTQQTSYLRATLKGMALTFSHLLRPKVTMQYPEEKSSKDWTLSSRWRGTHRMLTDEQGRATCLACGPCPQICPAYCIKLVPGEDEEGNRYPLIYEIDEFRCVFCGYCQEVCPEEAIHVGVHYEN